MLSSLLALAMVMQTDTTRAARETFTRCLSQFVESSVQARKTQEQFNTEYPQACAAEQTAFREAVIRRDMAMRATRASASQSADLEVEDARVNYSERFEMSIAPR